MGTTTALALYLFVIFTRFISGSAKKLWEGVWQKQSINCKLTHWLHLPKTSSMFCLSIQHACCPTQYEELTAGVTKEELAKSLVVYKPKGSTAENMGFNSSYCYHFYREGHPNLDCKFAGPTDHDPLYSFINMKQEMGMTIVREPKSRVISAYLDNVHKEGFHRFDYWNLRVKLDAIDKNTSISAEEKDIEKCLVYTSHPLLKGLQIKLLTGGGVVDFTKTDDVPMLEKLLSQAIDRLRQFFFVGVFDEYIRSMKLFHELANVGKYKY